MAFVQGGSRGIGAAIVRRLAREGAQVAFTYVSSAGPAEALAEEVKAAGGQALALRADSADAAALQLAVDDAVKAFGRLDILVNNAERMPFAGGAPYAMSKSALVGLTKGMARDLGPQGITVNNLQPGPVDTDMNPASGEFAESLIPLMAVGRYGQADEIASFVAYLAGPEAGYITGASLTVDGGFAA
ncbi:SDR family oxidoreductase [Pantoea sp. Tr-811]|uniref:SDR family oxidoreductase n=1 Tax=Pantoea sp. Tr-811 TaxID=2608361 RepID=UPI0014245F48|nr:SDR family oxidoreductase [Pantoea sp. Tr-811]